MSVNVGTAVGYLDLDASKFKAGLKDAQSTLSEFTNQSNNAGTRFEALGSSLKTVGSTITTAVSLPLLALGAGAIKTASDFEAGMSKVSALSGATGDDLKMLEDKAREMGASTKYSATESAEALSYMALAGWDAEQMAEGLEPSLKLAGAAGMDLAFATDIVTDTMSMFGMEASEATKMTDMLAYAQANSNTDVQQLGEALKYCGASANAMGYDLADTTALLGTFADQGLKGSSAGTTLNAMFRDMKKNAKDGAIAIGDTNVAIVDANGNYRDMTDILADVQKATEGMTQAERDMALSSIWGTEALKGVNMAFEAGVPKIREFEEGIRNSDGAANEMYDTMQNNLQGAIDNMKSAFEGLLITIGQRLIPIFQNLVEGITNVFTWFNNLNPAIQNVIIGVGGFLAILGPLLLIVGNVIIFIGIMIAIITLSNCFKEDIQTMIDAIEKKPSQFAQIQVPIDQIRPNPYQPRKHFDEEKLNELAQSIKEHGIFQPIILKQAIQGYEIVAGERRYRAASIVGLAEVPAIIVEFTDQQMMEIALLENIQREDLNAIEEAQAYQTMMKKLDLTQEELAKRIGKSRAHVANTVRLLKMPQKLQDYVLDGTLTMGHIKPLITIDEKKALEVARKAIDQQLSVREVEDIVKGIKLQEARKAKPKEVKPKEYVYVEGLLRKKYRTKIKVDEHTITLKYTDTQDLNRLLELMGVIEEE